MKQNHPAWGEVELRRGNRQPLTVEDIVSMCRYAEQDQPRPRRCVELRSPCDECAADEARKMDELGEEHMKCQLIRINDQLVIKSQ